MAVRSERPLTIELFIKSAVSRGMFVFMTPSFMYKGFALDLDRSRYPKVKRKSNEVKDTLNPKENLMKLRLRGFAPSYRSRYEIGSNRKEKKKTKTNLIKLLAYVKLKSRWKKLVESRSRYEIGSNRKDKKKPKQTK